MLRLRERLRDDGRGATAAYFRIVAFGDSVTQGFTRADTLEPDIVYHRLVRRALEAAHAGLKVEVVDAGLAMDTATDALQRLDHDVLRHRPDLVLVEFGLNDAAGLGAAAGGLAGIDGFRRALTELVDRILRSGAFAMLLTPNFMVSGDGSHLDAEAQAFLPVLRPLQQGGVVAAYAAAVREVAAARDVPVADVYRAWEDLAAAGRDPDELLANGLNHPNAEGHALAASAILDALGEPG